MSDIRQLLADALSDRDYAIGFVTDPEGNLEMADALLASPLAAIIDLAVSGWTLYDAKTRGLYPELEALLADWRTNR